MTFVVARCPPNTFDMYQCNSIEDLSIRLGFKGSYYDAEYDLQKKEWIIQRISWPVGIIGTLTLQSDGLLYRCFIPHVKDKKRRWVTMERQKQNFVQSNSRTTQVLIKLKISKDKLKRQRSQTL
mmetsp:Transcript_4885/g.5296  ORF Transcript_4885/g.5296 Transcript_4885/m.5296 type:complete len:124 (-) Transcript_4885:51-422(-)